MIFDKIYNLENRKEFLNFLRVKLFGDNLIENVRPLGIDRQTVFFDKKNCFELGNINLDKEITIFEIKHKSKNDPRITLTKDAFKIMEDKGINNALIVFYSDDNLSWRLSLLTLKKSWGEKEESNPKRYSFLLGEGEKTRTAKQYLVDKGVIKNFEDLHSRFDVEVVRKEFFDNYLELYVRLYKSITDDKEFISLLKNQKVDIVSFTKNLLGKIVFLYFIQKKGWLGVKKDGEYGKDGDTNFMRSFWNTFKSDNKTVWEDTGFFYNDYLEHLFYEGLNKDNRDDNDLSDYFDFKVPYLNGGLFKKDYEKWNKNEAKISNDIFSNDDKNGIFDIFDIYNFTIDEDDLYDKEVAIDPEMLGKIFEKMISISSENIDTIVEEYDKNKNSKRKKKLTIDNILNKKFGAFYTPREIVHYMTKESLIAYLVNNLKGKKEEKEKQIRKLFKLKDKFLITKDEITEEVFDQLAGIVEEVDELLKKVKILDPAIGSGAFPMGLLNEISTIRYYIYGVFYKTFGVNIDKYKNDNGKISMYKIKRNIIQNNIYGVDIEPGAIDIAKLRFWLSLVVDEDKPEPLPNFEFKFVCANTLIPLSESKEQGLQDNINIDTLSKYMTSFYNAQTNKDKEKYRNYIENYLGITEKKKYEKGGLGFIHKEKNNELKSKRQRQLETYEPFNSNHSANFFEPSLMMGNSKFDIVIGNPPYIKEYDNRNAFDGLRDKLYYMGKMDLWYYFACYGLDLLKDGGIESFIAQNNWITSYGAKKMRNKILEDARIKEFIDFGNFKVFENAGIQTMIYILEKTKNNITYEVKYSKIENKDFDRRNINKFLYDDKNTEEYSKHYSKILKSKYLDKTIDFADEEKGKILSKMMTNSNFKLNNKEVIQGIVGAPDKYYLIENLKNFDEKENAFIKKFYSNVGRYYEGISNSSIIYIRDNSLDLENDYINLYNHFKDNIELLNEARIKLKTPTKKYYNLHRDRDETFFNKGGKIVCGTRVEKPSFYYTEDEFYGSRALNFIKTDRINLKYLTALLNSNLNYFWLKNKGKMLGNLLQIDKSHLLSFPIKQISEEKQKPFIELVDKILEITKQENYDPKNPPKEQLKLEKEIDQMVYKLYGLSEEEIEVVEGSLV